MARKDVSKLRDEAAKAVEKGKWREAIALYGELEERQPLDAGWPKKIGETCRRAGAPDEAIVAYERAVDKYVGAGFLVQAIAVCKLILQIEPKHAAALARLSEHAPAPVRRPQTTGPVAIPAGAALDAVPLAQVMIGARPDASGGMVIPLEEGELEMIADEPSRGTAIDAAIMAAMPDVPAPVAGPAARRALLATPLLASLPPGGLEALISRLSLVDMAPGDVLFHEGDPGGALFVVVDGEVVVESAAGGELAWLGPGAFFGEIALVTDLPRSATIRAPHGAQLLQIDRDVIRELVAAHPAVLGVILRFVRDRLVAKVMQTSELFKPFIDDDRAALTQKFELVEVDPGTVLIRQGKRADGLYVVLAGRVEVWRDGEAAAIATLGTGEVFGEMSLLHGAGATAHVRAATKVLALRMPSRTFQEVIMTHPQVLQYVGELAEQRHVELY